MQLRDIKNGDSNTPFPLPVPRTCLYTITTTTNKAEFNNTSLENCVLTLHGDIYYQPDTPSVMVLSHSSIDPLCTKASTNMEFKGKRQDRTLNKHFSFAARDIKNKVELTPLIPVPAYIVYDAFTKDIDVLTVYERFMAMREDNRQENICPKCNKALRMFLKSCTILPTVLDPQTRVQYEMFIMTPPAEAKL